MASVLVTGSSGFVGSHLAALCAASDLKIVGLDLRASGHTDMVCDVKEKALVAKILKENGVEKVIHLAAHIDAAESVRKPLKYLRNNALGTIMLLEAMRKSDSKEIVFVSSAAVYGRQEEFPILENAPLAPVNHYGLSKLLAERSVESYHESYGLNYTILRPSNLYGIGQNDAYAGVISRFVDAAIKGTAPVLHGDGSQTRDFLNVKDMVEALRAVAMQKGKNATYNVSFGKPVRITELLETVQRIAGKNIEPKRGPKRPGDIERSELSSEKFREAYGWKPEVKLEDGIGELLRHYKTAV